MSTSDNDEITQLKTKSNGQASADAAEFKRLLEDITGTDDAKIHHHSTSEEPASESHFHKLSLESFKQRRVISKEESVRGRSNDAAIISILCKRSIAERQEIIHVYKTAYNKDLIHDINKAVKGEFGELIYMLMLTPAQCDARQLHYAINSTSALTGMCTKNSTLIEILCTRTNQQIREIRREYRHAFSSYLEHDLTRVTWHHLMHLFMYLSASTRDESDIVDQTVAENDAALLRAADDEHFGRQSTLFSIILATQNYAQLRAMFSAYKQLTGNDFDKVVEGEFTGDYQDGLLAIIAAASGALPTFFANRLHQAMHSLGTHDTSLIRMVVTRSETDLQQIKGEYQRLFEKELNTDISTYCSGSFRDGLLAIVQ